MGHYDDSRDLEHERELGNLIHEIMEEITTIQNIHDARFVKKLISKRDKLKTLFEIFDRGLK